MEVVQVINSNQYLVINSLSPSSFGELHILIFYFHPESVLFRSAGGKLLHPTTENSWLSYFFVLSSQPPPPLETQLSPVLSTLLEIRTAGLPGVHSLLNEKEGHMNTLIQSTDQRDSKEYSLKYDHLRLENKKIRTLILWNV